MSLWYSRYDLRGTCHDTGMMEELATCSTRGLGRGGVGAMADTLNFLE